MSAQRIEVRETMELESSDAIAGMVQANLGVSIVPDLALQPDHAVPVKRISLGDNAPSRTLGLVTRKDQVKTQAIDAVFVALSQVIAQAAEAG